MKEKSRGLDQLCHFLRELGRPSHSKPIEQQSSNGALRQMVERIYYPFYGYLLKVLQDREMYSAILQRKGDPSLLWKMANLSKSLGSIITELNRICRYFKKDLTGIYYHFAYLISLDANLYYDSLRDAVSTQCAHWRQAIAHIEDRRAEDYEAYLLKRQELFRDGGFVELQRYIEEVAAIREDLIWIYMNKELRCCLKHFGRPINGVQVEIYPKTSHISFLQAYIEKQTVPATRPHLA
jgi:hypothetical protein